MIGSNLPTNASFIRSEPSEDAQFLQFLIRADELLLESLDYHSTLRHICEAAVETVADICFLDLVEDNRLELVTALHHDPALSPLLQNAGSFLYSDPGRPEHPCMQVLRTERSILVAKIDEQYIREAGTSAMHATFMRTMEYRSVMYVPMLSQSQGILGTMTLVRTARRYNPFTHHSLLFAEHLARRCGGAIARNRLHAEVLDIAIRFQNSSLPKSLPQVAGFAIDSYYEPAGKVQLVGGDWYDMFFLSKHHIAITIGDALGHGIEASILMNSLRHGLRGALYGEPHLSRALEIADRIVHEESPNTFATALIGLLDVKNRRLSCLSAGHPGPLLWTAHDQILDPFLERGLPLGLRRMGASASIPAEIPFHPKDFAVFFTDGLLEWNHDIPTAQQALEETIRSPRVRHAKQPARKIRDAVIGRTHPDDVAILTMRKT